MIEKAKSCHDCLCWLEYCKAECCKGFECPVGSNAERTIKDGVFKVRVPMNPDKRWYLELHGVKVQGDVLIIPAECCEFLPHLVTVHMTCKLLTEDNLCAGHADGKPEICKGLTLESTRNVLPVESHAAEEGYRLTPDCLFNFKK